MPEHTQLLALRLEQLRETTIRDLEALRRDKDLDTRDWGIIGAAIRLLQVDQRSATNTPNAPNSPREATENAMVAALAPAMVEKLGKARAKGRGGWEVPEECSIEHLHDCLTEHCRKTNLDMVDVANIAGMIWWRLEHVPGDRVKLLEHMVGGAKPRPLERAAQGKS